MRAAGSLHWLHTVSTRRLTWYFAHPRRGREAMDAAGVLPDFRGRAVHAFCNALRDHPDGLLAFLRDCAVPFDNNRSERDLRMMKLRQKISGTFRSLDALADFCPESFRGYVSTARKNGLNALDALRRVFTGHPFVPILDRS